MAPSTQGLPRDSRAHNIASIKASDAVEQDREKWFEEQLHGLTEYECDSHEYER